MANAEIEALYQDLKELEESVMNEYVQTLFDQLTVLRLAIAVQAGAALKLATFNNETSSINCHVKGKRRANRVKIAYNVRTDSYDLTFYKFNASKRTYQKLEHVADVYTESLVDVFKTFFA